MSGEGRQGVAKPSRAQEQILGTLYCDGRLFSDGFHYSLMRAWSGSREYISVRMARSLLRAGWINEQCQLTAEGSRVVRVMLAQEPPDDAHGR